MMIPLEIARKRQKENRSIYTCHDCKNCVKVGNWWYCEDSGKMLHPMMLIRTNPIACKRAVPKDVLRMTDKINGRTPEEIKMWLECCLTKNGCKTCHYEHECYGQPDTDALAYIQQIEHSFDELFETAKRLERERDAALEIVRGDCGICAHWKECVENDSYIYCNYPSCWEWIGVREVE